MMNSRKIVAAVFGLAALLAGAAPAQAQELRFSRQPGLCFMPLHVIEKQRLIEKHAARLGLPAISVKWLSFANASAQQDALLSGNADVVNTGSGPLLTLWDRTKGGVKAIAVSCAIPLTLITRDPKIRTLKDFGPGDKIAVPTIKVSIQSLLLQITAGDMYGADKWSHFDPLTVQMSHPDGYIAMKNASHEVKTHFAAPPYDFFELKEVPGARVITDSAKLMGGPLSQGMFFTSTKFADANPKIIQAVRAAAEEAKVFIEKDLRASIEIYREINNDKTPADTLVEIMQRPGMQDWSLHPQGTMKLAAHLHRVGLLKTAPASWKDYFLPIAHDLPGN